MLSLLTYTLAAPDLAHPMATPEAMSLSSSPNIWLTHGFISPEVVKHMRSKVPKDESAYSPCIGQVDEFASKRCTYLPVAGDPIVEAVVEKVSKTWEIDTSRLREGLPIIRYLPGAPAVGKHGDEDRHGSVPNATLVLYLTDSDATVESKEAATGQTVFPEAGVTVTPKGGSILSFQNVDEVGAPHPNAKHLVSAVPKDAASDRLVVQIPIAHAAGVKPFAYPEHVSGNKKPGQHEKMHGTAEQKAAASAAAAAGMCIAVVYMAAKNGKFDPSDKDDLEKEARETGKFSDDDFKPQEPK